MRGGFIWDDDAYVTNNPLLTAPDGWQRIWFSAHKQSQFFPLVFTTLRLEYALWGLNPLGYHLVNVLLHAANALLVWTVLRKLAVPGAWLAAALFAFHPVQVESVAWVTELKNTQSTLFYLLTLLMWLRFLGDQSPPRWTCYLLTLLFYVLALLSKTTACTLVAALLLVPWMKGQRIGWGRALQVVPFVVLGVAAGLVSIWWESHLGNYEEDVGQSLTWIQRTLIATRALWFYVAKLAWPASLTFSYPHWNVSATEPAAYAWLGGCLVVAFVLWRWRRTVGRGVIGSVFFFVATLSPLLGFIPLYTFRFSYVADHYQYVASIGLLALAAAVLNRTPRALPATLLAVLGILTWKQAHIYRNQTVLWQDTLAKNPSSWMAHNNLGLVFKNEGQIAKAIHHYRETIRLKPDYAGAHYNLGIVLFKNGQTDDAMIEFQQAIRLGPNDSRAYYNLAIALERGGQSDEAIRQYQQAIRLNPDYVGARLNLGVAFSHGGRVDEAMTQFQEAVRLAPDDAEARNNLGAVLRAKGRLDDALGQFREAIRLDPAHPLAHANLGSALLEKGQLDEAIRQLQEALRLNPRDANSRESLVRALGKKASPPTR
jgi:Flp pilus assembly protein TadD